MNCNILIVDDSPILRAAIKKVAKIAGLDDDHIFEAGNGVEALEQLKEHWIDLILLDLNMPIMDGEQFLRVRQDNEDARDVPVVIISTESNEARLNRLNEFGAIDRLHKPFEPEDLCKIISKLLGAAA